MAILVVAEHNNATLGAATLNTVTAAQKIGGDILCNKKTYMLIKALERANGEQLEELNRWLNAENCQPAEKIAAVTEIYNQLTIRSVCENKMREYYTLAMESLEAVAVAEEKKKELNGKRKRRRF